MNAALRHLAVRFWLTALTGGAAGILFLPLWQQLLGVEWLMVPSVVLTVGCFVGVGWVMNRIGLGFLQRNVNEAATWERAGMSAESETAFGKAMATFDSFWISPLLRHRKFQWFSGVMARFYMGRHPESALGRRRVAAHLCRFPRDAAAAEPWLESLLAYERHLPLEHEAVVRISQQLGIHRRIRRLLMQFYMINGRTDFDAVQTYRRVWHEQGSLPAESVRDLARLLRNDHVLTPWALQVYLAAHQAGDKTAVEGIAAAVRWLPATEESRPHLKAAKEMLNALDRPMPEGAAISKFRPEIPAQAASRRRRPERARSRTRPTAREAMSRLKSWLNFKELGPGEHAQKWLPAMPVRYVLPAVTIVLIIALLAVAGWRLYHRPVQTAQPQTMRKVVEEPVITDPFTIQVAAYLKRDDAQRLVDQLIQAGLDAFWTQAASAHRSWYQVKVSHFETREGAQAYGRELKSKGLIDDFYVANYEHERRNTIKPK
jgi:hypothetical protein